MLELAIVFVGVYLAFVLQDFSEDLQEAREQDKIYRALKYELEGFRFLMPGQAAYATGVRNQMQTGLDNGRITDFSEWRFIAPQYDYQIIEYAINVQNSEIVDFALFERLKTRWRAPLPSALRAPLYGAGFLLAGMAILPPLLRRIMALELMQSRQLAR